MRIIIAGSREFNNYDLLRTEVLKIVKDLKLKGFNIDKENVQIISGTARGADKLGERFANEFKLKLVQFPADWNLGKQAGYLRNAEMSKYAKQDKEIGILIAFWNGSNGTKHMIDLANKDNLKTYIIRF